MIKYKIRGSDWLTFALIIINFNHFFIQPAPELIDMEDYVSLYSTNQSREIFPYWKFNKFDFESWDDTECYKELRFGKDDIL